MYDYGLDHRELGDFFLLADCPMMCEGISSSYDRYKSQDHEKMVTTVERLERTTEKGSLLVRTTMAIGFCITSKKWVRYI